MPTDHEHEEKHDPLHEMGYEVADIEYKGFAKAVGWFLAFVVFCGVAGFIIFALFMSNGSPGKAFEMMTNAPPSTAPFAKRVPADPNPRLQTNTETKTDIRDLRREEDMLLHGSPTYVDKNKGVVRIPIERAVDIYLQRKGDGSIAGTSAATTLSSQPAIQSGGALEGSTNR